MKNRMKTTITVAATMSIVLLQMQLLPLYLLFVVLLPEASCFLEGIPEQKFPTTANFVETMLDHTKLNILLDIHNNNDNEHHHLPIHGLTVQLHHGEQRRLDILSKGRFIDFLGTQYIEPQEPLYWDMIWGKNNNNNDLMKSLTQGQQQQQAAEGHLVIGMDIPQDYERNAAILPKGYIEVHFPIWTKKGIRLNEYKKKRFRRDNQKYLDERDRQIELFDQTDNKFMKAYHLYKGFAAVGKYYEQEKKQCGSIGGSTSRRKSNNNAFVDDVVRVAQNQFMIGRQGFVLWSCKNNRKRLQKKKQQEQYLMMGTANIKL